MKGATRCWVLALLAVLAVPAWPVFAAAAPCAVPASLDDGWQAIEPAEAGFDAAALCELLDGVKTGGANIHAVIVERHGKLVAELYRSGRDRSIYTLFAHEVAFGPTALHDLRSISKSVVGLLFGIVQARGQIGPVTAPVLDFYPRYAELRTPERDAVTLESLLTMSSGLEWNESLATYGGLRNDETRLYWDWAPYRFVLSRPIVQPPGARFNYNGGGTAVLADIVARRSGLPLRELARTALFEPLGIRDWEWVGDPHFRPLAFAGLRMRPRDVAKLGRLMLDHGRWQGREVVPSAWVDEMLKPRLDTGDGLQYGYQWWSGTVESQGRAMRWSAGFGNGGQRLFVVPELDLSVVITAGDYNQAAIGPAVNRLFKRIAATLR